MISLFRRSIGLVWVLSLSFASQLSAQTKARPSLQIKRASSPMVLDGNMTETAWLEADIAHDYWQTFPMDTSASVAKTTFRMTYDDKFLYVLAMCYTTTEGDYYVTPSLRRDFRGPGNDIITLFLIPFRIRPLHFCLE